MEAPPSSPVSSPFHSHPEPPCPCDASHCSRDAPEIGFRETVLSWGLRVKTRRHLFEHSWILCDPVPITNAEEGREVLEGFEGSITLRISIGLLIGDDHRLFWTLLDLMKSRANGTTDNIRLLLDRDSRDFSSDFVEYSSATFSMNCYFPIKSSHLPEPVAYVRLYGFPSSQTLEVAAASGVNDVSFQFPEPFGNFLRIREELSVDGDETLEILGVHRKILGVHWWGSKSADSIIDGLQPNTYAGPLNIAGIYVRAPWVKKHWIDSRFRVEDVFQVFPRLMTLKVALRDEDGPTDDLFPLNPREFTNLEREYLEKVRRAYPRAHIEGVRETFLDHIKIAYDSTGTLEIQTPYIANSTVILDDLRRNRPDDCQKLKSIVGLHALYIRGFDDVCKVERILKTYDPIPWSIILYSGDARGMPQSFDSPDLHLVDPWHLEKLGTLRFEPLLETTDGLFLRHHDKISNVYIYTGTRGRKKLPK